MKLVLVLAVVLLAGCSDAPEQCGKVVRVGPADQNGNRRIAVHTPDGKDTMLTTGTPVEMSDGVCFACDWSGCHEGRVTLAGK